MCFSGQSAQEAGRLAKEFSEKSWMFAKKQMKIDAAKSSKNIKLGPMAVTVDSLSPKAQKMHKEVTEFVRELIIPLGKSKLILHMFKVSDIQKIEFWFFTESYNKSRLFRGIPSC